GDYNYEGYNVYQLPKRSSSLSEAKRIATFDLPDDPTVVLDEQFDNVSGQVLFKPVQFGANSGITRYFKFNRDHILDFDKIYNGQEYYLGVTAYSVAKQAGFLPAALESEPLIITVRSKVPFGTKYPAVFGDTLSVSHTGVSDGIVLPIVIDPTANKTGRDQTYEVRFDTTGGETTWRLLNTTANKVVVSGQTNQSGDANYNIQEGGVFLLVSGPPPGMKDFGLNGTTRRISFAGAELLGLEGFSGAIGLAFDTWFSSSTVTPDKLKNVVLKFAATDVNGNLMDPNDPDASFAYRYMRRAANPPAKPEFAPFIVNPGAGYAYQDYKKVMPFAAYDTEANPPRRLMVGFHENNIVDGLVDGKWWPPETGSGQPNAFQANSPREFFFVFDVPYSETPDPALQKDALNNTLPIMWWGGPLRRGSNVSFVGNEEFVIFANHINQVTDVFKYTVAAPTKGAALEQASANKIGVYPNPYYAFNPAETNRLFRFVTFNNLPREATVRIFNLAGQLVRRIEKDDDAQFLQWDLLNHDNIPVASGMYVAYIDATLPSGGSAKKVLKLAVIQEQEVLDIY
ncbi:MAG: T9SS type A sorting domain-containing protein, partial [bacterium]